jgi:hypothetical protein
MWSHYQSGDGPRRTVLTRTERMHLPINSTKLQSGQRSPPTDRRVIRAASAHQVYSYRVYKSDKKLLYTVTCATFQAVSGSDLRRRA